MDDTNEGVTITHEAQGTGGKYVAHVPGENVTGYLEWESRGENIRVATHTIVPSAIGGRGIAGLLVDRLIADARIDGFQIVPQCSYVARKFEQNPEWSDLRA
ncbi:MAG: GNAT family N-acetyltransferase [Pseudomonadota bacterium]